MSTESAVAQIRSLAERLSAAEDADVSRLLGARGVSPHVVWRDWFDAADALLAPDSAGAAIAALPRDALCDLAEGTGPERLGLTDPSGTPYPLVSSMLPTGLTRTPSSVPAAASDGAAAHAAERAFTGMSAMADVLLDAVRAPLARVGRRLGANDRRRLSQDGPAASPEDADLIVSAAASAGLLRADDRRWLVTEDGLAWAGATTPDRWERLADGLRSSLPEGLRGPASGWIDPTLWPDAYPLAAAWADEAAHLTAVFRLAGLIADDGEPPWATPLREGGAADAAALTALLPGEVDQVFLQNDLTAISPGTLSPPLDMRLRSMAVRESHAQASTYRFTEASVNAALAGGETAASLRGFLEDLSLTGVPQPLAYLVDRAAERHGLVRVEVDDATGHTIVTSADAHLRDTIGVDQSLRSLGLVSDGEGLRSRADRHVVYWALADARYPVVAVDAAGETLVPGRSRIASDPTEPVDRFGPLIERLRESEKGDTDAAWLERELSAAVRAKSALLVTVAMPDGSTRELVLEATGLGGGRLRGLDRGADVERTLPLKSISSVRPA